MFLGLSTVFKVAIVLGLALTAFFIATIVVAVQKSDLEDEVAYLKSQLAALKTTPAPPLPTTDPTTSTTAVIPEEVHYRLPGDVIPISYELNLDPDLVSGKFNGFETITIAVIKDTNVIILHSNGLEITDVVVVNKIRRTTKAVAGYTLDKTTEFLIITLTEQLVKGMYLLEITFNGESRNKIVGLYSSSYTNGNGDVNAVGCDTIYQNSKVACNKSATTQIATNN